jgi:hypothetical protein
VGYGKEPEQPSYKAYLALGYIWSGTITSSGVSLSTSIILGPEEAAMDTALGKGKSR